MTYQDIAKVNSEMSTIDLKGKNYAMVPDRVNAFRKLYPEGFIRTEIVEHDGTTVTMQAQVGYYENGNQVILGTGLAQEVRGKGLVNGTSYIENCETSAVGRALGMIGLGIGGGGICSAEELVNAITAQKQNEAESKKPKEELPKQFGPKKEPKAEVETAAAVPGVPALSKEMQWLSDQLTAVALKHGSTLPAIKKVFEIQRKAGVAEGMLPDKRIAEYNLDELDAAIEYMEAALCKGN